MKNRQLEGWKTAAGVGPCDLAQWKTGFSFSGEWRRGNPRLCGGDVAAREGKAMRQEAPPEAVSTESPEKRRRRVPTGGGVIDPGNH